MKNFFEEIKEKTVHFSQERPRSSEDSRGFSMSKAYFPKEIANSSLSNANFHEEGF
jgi:hypothetical protein